MGKKRFALCYLQEFHGHHTYLLLLKEMSLVPTELAIVEQGLKS